MKLLINNNRVPELYGSMCAEVINKLSIVCDLGALPRSEERQKMHFLVVRMVIDHKRRKLNDGKRLPFMRSRRKQSLSGDWKA